jgi:hypothetical protein
MHTHFVIRAIQPGELSLGALLAALAVPELAS